MFRSTYKTAVLAFVIEFCKAQESLLGGFWPYAQPSGPLGASLPFGQLGLLPFGNLGQSGEQGTPVGFGQYGFMPFGMMGSIGQSGEQSGTEAAAEAAERPSYPRPSLIDLNMMLLWNQLLSNQGSMPQYDSSKYALESESNTQKANTNVVGTKPVNNAGQNPSADMSWLPFFLLQH